MASTAVRKAAGIGLTDAAALLFIYLVPTLSHLTAVPFYLIDPMRLAVLGALLATRNWKNALVLAVTLPLFSSAVGMHPIFPKCVLIAAELSVNVLLFSLLVKAFTARLSSRSGDGATGHLTGGAAPVRIGLAAFISILLSKAFYYGLKALVLGAGLMQMELVSTALWVQLVVAVLISAGFAFFWRNTRSQ